MEDMYLKGDDGAYAAEKSPLNESPEFAAHEKKYSGLCKRERKGDENRHRYKLQDSVGENLETLRIK